MAEDLGRRQRLLMLTQASFDENMSQLNDRLDKIEETMAHVTELMSGLIEQFPDFVDHLHNINEEFNAPIEFQRGPDGRLHKATRGKRSISINRDDASRFSGAK